MALRTVGGVVDSVTTGCRAVNADCYSMAGYAAVTGGAPFRGKDGAGAVYIGVAGSGGTLGISSVSAGSMLGNILRIAGGYVDEAISMVSCRLGGVVG